MLVTVADPVKTEKSKTAREGQKICSRRHQFTLSLIHAGRQSLCDVQLTPLPLPICHGCGGRTWGRGEEQTRPVMGKHETKVPSHRYAWIGKHMSLFACVSVWILQRRSLSRKLQYVKKNVVKSIIGNWKMQPVTGNFTGNWLTDYHITTLHNPNPSLSVQSGSSNWHREKNGPSWAIQSQKFRLSSCHPYVMWHQGMARLS